MMRKLALGLAALALACQAEDAAPDDATTGGSGGAAAGAASGGVSPTGGASGSSTGGTAGTATGGTAGSPSGGTGAGAGGTGAGGASASGGSASGAAGAAGSGDLGGVGGAGGASGTAGAGGVSGSGAQSGMGGKAGGGGSGGGAALCATRTGGALIDMSIAGQSLRLWFTNTAFINEMAQNVGRIAPRQPVLDLVQGRDCDPQWTWHANPANPSFAPAHMDICASWPSDIEQGKTMDAGWREVGWCPDMVQVVAVRRQ